MALGFFILENFTSRGVYSFHRLLKKYFSTAGSKGKEPSMFKGDLRATTIGSLPLADPREATALVFKYASLLPSWVQLPKFPGEGMLEQYNEGLPGIKETPERCYFDTDDPEFEQAVLSFYEGYLAVTESGSPESLEHFAISRDRARGFFSFTDMLAEYKDRAPAIVKGQVTGPFTLATGLKDQQGKFAYYNPQLRDIIVKHISLKALWQIRKLQQFNVSVLMFLDEPSLCGFGSTAYLGVEAEDIKKDLNEAVSLIHNEKAWVGVHCCENTDWAILLQSDIDVLNFDAYGFFDRVFLFKQELVAFLNRGGTLAWGIVPTHSEEVISKVTPEMLINLWKEEVQKLSSSGVAMEKIISQSLITPSCGMGSLSAEAALKVLHLLDEVSRRLRREFNLS
jgi:methionine synthase II (cobalamin-independent)